MMLCVALLGLASALLAIRCLKDGKEFARLHDLRTAMRPEYEDRRRHDQVVGICVLKHQPSPETVWIDQCADEDDRVEDSPNHASI